MRVEDARPRTWLLAAAAGWWLLAWLLAAVGMGGRVELLPADPTLLEPIPPLRPAPPLRLGPLGQYSAIAARPLFTDDRRPHPFFLEGQGEATEDKAFDYVLTSVLITPGLQMAILQPPDGGESVRVKLNQAPESHPAWRLATLNERSAVFAGPEGERTLELRVFNGEGGEPPTAISTPRPPDAQRPAGRTDMRAATQPANPAAPARMPKPDPQAATDPMPTGDAADAADTAEAADAAAPTPAKPMTEQAQMDAIRQRIQARREQLRRQQQAPPSPPAEGP